MLNGVHFCVVEYEPHCPVDSPITTGDHKQSDLAM